MRGVGDPEPLPALVSTHLEGGWGRGGGVLITSSRWGVWVTVQFGLQLLRLIWVLTWHFKKCMCCFSLATELVMQIRGWLIKAISIHSYHTNNNHNT